MSMPGRPSTGKKVPTDNRIFAVAMSGGVDSSVAAALLKRQGYPVIGVMMRLWGSGPEGYNRCCSPIDLQVAQQIADHLTIPFYIIDLKDQFKTMVVDPFIDGYAKGFTPNPCIACNRYIRWTASFKEITQLGATHLATGHYARIEERAGRFLLLSGKDKDKDQSYVLSILNQEHLSRTIFPIGGYTKNEVRSIAKQMGLSVADKPESQDLCFVTEGNYREFLQTQRTPLPPPGPIINQEGILIGEHIGLANYTIGQRKGIGVSHSEPLYVLEKTIETNTLVVGPVASMGKKSFIAGPINWISGERPRGSITVEVKVRYRSNREVATVTPTNECMVEVRLNEKLPDITPGQSAVFYRGEVCLGGGVIQR